MLTVILYYKQKNKSLKYEVVSEIESISREKNLLVFNKGKKMDFSIERLERYEIYSSGLLIKSEDFEEDQNKKAEHESCE